MNLAKIALVASALVGVVYPVVEGGLLTEPLELHNVIPDLNAREHLVRDPDKAPARTLPIAVPPFEEHVRGTRLSEPITVSTDGTAWTEAQYRSISGLACGPSGELYVIAQGGGVRIIAVATGEVFTAPPTGVDFGGNVDAHWDASELLKTTLPSTDAPKTITVYFPDNRGVWLNTERGLEWSSKDGTKTYVMMNYKVPPMLSKVTCLALDSQDTIWAGTPFGLLSRSFDDGEWTVLRGHEGLPYEDITSIAIDKADRIWLGTTKGLIQFRPYEPGRQWFYRAGPRYLIDDAVQAVAVAPDGKSVYAATPKGISRLDVATTTLLERAQTIEKRVNERHRRMGLVAECNLDNADNPTSHVIGDNDNDGLWTAYHIAAMSLCYGATKDAEAKRSAKEGMHALYMLQNASGISGIVARSVVLPDVGVTKDADKPEERRQWRKTPDGTMYWKSDTSSDEIDGHYLAFYAYYEHIAKDDPEELALIQTQTRALTDYLIANGYRLIDWNGKRTRWGFWDPETLNGNPDDYVENGLNSLQMLSFLRVAHYVTGDAKYLEHYKKLIVEYGYLDNILLSKKVWPDENNHSDDQLGFVAWYPILQIEKDPVISKILLGAVRRHYRVVAEEQPSFYTFAYATVDAEHADIEGAIENLRQIPTDRRSWEMENSHRADVDVNPHPNRFGKPQLTRVVPADERAFQKWNGDPYVPDAGGDGRHEDDGAAYLLPYWMGRYHGFIAEAN